MWNLHGIISHWGPKFCIFFKGKVIWAARSITNGGMPLLMNIDRWISKWCHEITSISKCNETACQEKYVSLSNLYFFQEDCSSLSLVVRGSCLLIMQNWKISHFCGNSSQRENSFVRIDATLRQNTNSKLFHCGSIYFEHKI